MIQPRKEYNDKLAFMVYRHLAIRRVMLTFSFSFSYFKGAYKKITSSIEEFLDSNQIYLPHLL